VIYVCALFTAVVVCTSLAGCGHSVSAPIPPTEPIAASPDVTVTIDGQRHACVVSLSNQINGRAIACSLVVAYLQDELRLPRNSIYDIHTVPDIGESEMTVLDAQLKAAGFRFIGGLHVGFITAPPRLSR